MKKRKKNCKEKLNWLIKIKIIGSIIVINANTYFLVFSNAQTNAESIVKNIYPKIIAAISVEENLFTINN